MTSSAYWLPSWDDYVPGDFWALWTATLVALNP